MTNHNPTFTSSSASGSFSETANTTGSTTQHLLSGTMNFTDSDHSDTHTTAAALHSIVWSGGSTIPTASLTDLTTAMSSSITSDHNGSGALKWSFAAADDDFDFLAKNETLTLTYDITVSDNHGGSTKQTVKVTITGTDDKPVISMQAVASVTEQANTTLSLALDTTHVALHFVDPDLDNTGYTASVTAATATGATAGLLPGSLGTAELMAFFNVDNIVKASGSSNGTINTTFSAPDLAFDYLAAGQTLNITYTVLLDDHAGGTSTQNVVVTVIGTNDKPIYLSGPESAHLTEGQHLSGGNLTASGDLVFTDIDLADAHTVSTTVSASTSNGSAIPLSNAALLSAMSTSLFDSTGHLLGDVDWNFALSNNSVNFLGAGVTLTLNYNITVTDPSHASDTETVTITILGTNHPVTITSGPESASLAEQPNTTGSAAVDTTSPVPTGTLNFSDPDTGDTHTVAVTVGSETWSGGSSIPAATQTDLTTALATTLHDSTGSGTGGVDWSFGIPDHDLDFLALGETLTINYNVKVSDASTSATQTVSVTVTGDNDAPVITSGPEAASLAEQPGVSGSSSLDTTSPVPTGTLAFTDPDLTDTHQVGVALDSAVWSGDPFFVPSDTLVDLQTALATVLHDSNGTGSGTVDWTFSIPDKDLDFLAPGDTLTATYDVTVSDGAAASSTQQVTITMTGAADPLTVNPVTATVNDSIFQDAGQVVLVGNVITDGGDTGGDQTTVLGVTDVNGQAVTTSSVTEVVGTYGSLFISGEGFYQFVANGNVDPLQVGDNPTEQFNFTVTDSLGRSETTTLTLNIVGGDDAPFITSAVASGTITEDQGPSTVINGGFETGDLSGWTASGNTEAQILGLGGEFGNYAAQLGPGSGNLSQNVATASGEHYTLSFDVFGDPSADSNTLTVTWDGATVLTLNDDFGGLTHYSFDVLGDASNSTTPLAFSFSDNGVGLFLDQVTVASPTGPATETSDGSIHFSDETADTHTASFVADGSGYVGAFSLDPVSETGGSGSVDWHFSVDNADIQFLSQGQVLNQVYTVSVTDDHDVSTTQDVSVTMIGTNDAPTANPDTVITDAGADGAVGIPGWTLVGNDTDPDMLDSLSVTGVGGGSGGAPLQLGDIVGFFDDSTPGGSFTYQATDGIAASNAATVTIVNNATSTTTLTGTGANEILIATQGSEAINGGGGNDVLIGGAGSHALTGGAGDDIFAFQQPNEGPDTITDFNNTTEHDRIGVSASGFGGPLTPGMDASFLFETSGDDQFISPFSLFHFDTGNQTLYYSPDGTTGSEVALAQVQAGVVLQAHDLLIT